MNENSNEHDAVRQYLLGNLRDETKMRQIEENLLLDDDFAEQLSIAEDELVDEYLNDALTEPERRRFLQFFLIAPQRKEKLRFIGNLKKYADRASVRLEVKESPPKKTEWFDWRRLFASPAWRFAAIALLMVGTVFVIQRTQTPIERAESEVDKGLAQLRLAYRGQRPLESRTTANFDYVERTTTRGPKDADADAERARRAAEKLLTIAATENNSNAEALHALGLLYLADKKFDEALEEFNRALKLAPGNAKLHSDLGTAYLEKANLAAEDKKGDEFSKNADEALKHLDRALELDGNLLEALFNKALLLQKIPNPTKAREAWEKYLEKDSTSQWAAEAKENIRKLDSKKSQNLSADQLEQAFLNAFREKNKAEATQLISRNREMITENYLPQRLAMSLVEAPGDKKPEYLEALQYAGQLEKEHIGDLFAADIGVFYTNASETDLEILKNAQALVRDGYRSCRDGQTEEALKKFKLARELFLQAGNVWEAKLSEYFIAHCLINSGLYKESLPLSEEIINFCRRKDYQWLLSNTLLWFGVAQRKTGQRALAKSSYLKSLELAEKLEDCFMLQGTNLELAKLNTFVGQDKEAAQYLQKVFKTADASGVSSRQTWRNYSDGVELLAKLKYDNLAKAVSLENLRLAEELENSLYINYSQLDVGITNTHVGDYEEARNWLLLAKKNAESIVNEKYRNDILAKSSLELGHVERKLGNYSQAADFYSEAQGYDKKNEYYPYEIRKSRLLAQLPLGNDAEIEKQIAETLEFAENLREQLSEEQERDSFFNNEQTIYDIAVDNDFKHGKREQAYNHLEMSNSRSLLDWLKKGVDIKEEKKKIEITFKAHAEAVQLADIRAQMPDRVQILQYAVLENKVLIFLVSKDDFKVVPSEIAADKLNEKATVYRQLVSNQDKAKQEQAKALGRELYDLLLGPVAAQLDPEREICVIPHKILFHLPFAALTAPDGKPFLARFNFSYAPSANAFLLFTENARQKAALTDESLLSIGNPRFDRKEFKDLEDLPDAEDEAREIMRFYPESEPPLIGAAATRTALQNSLERAEVIHFAGHYIVRNGEPLASALVLTKGDRPEDGILTNAELISRKLPRVKLVVLPACETGVEQYYNGEGLVGLSRTFLAAGAPLVVASQWKVESKATAELMKKFHSYRREGKLSTTAALRRAQLEMMESSDTQYRQPFFWAAFATYGGYAEF